MGARGPKKRCPKHQRLLKPLAILLIGAFVANFVRLHAMLRSQDRSIADPVDAPFRTRFRTRRDRASLHGPAPPARERRISRASLQNPPQSKRRRLEALEAKLGSDLKQKVVSCAKENERGTRATDRRCDAHRHRNDTDGLRRLAVYNPLPRDQFLCGGRIVLGPRKWKPLGVAAGGGCGFGVERRSYSFPHPPTFENRGQFPGIRVQKKRHAMDDTFSSGFRFREDPDDFGTHGCDVKCQVDLKSIPGKIYIDGIDAVFEYSMEGEAYFRRLKIDKSAWKTHKFYATTSLQSEVPHTYFSLWWGSPGSEYRTGLQAEQVAFSDGIKGAVFLARNCRSKSDREKLVKELMATPLRVDSLSSCLKTGSPPPGITLKDKSKVLNSYLFYLAFENQRTDDYITEKFWNALMSGTLPVYFGASNIKQHFPMKGAIFVDDFDNTTALAEYLIKVSNDEDLYNSYHEWRKEPYPPAFLEKQNFTLTPSQCRFCRWAHAYKYGLGWKHEKQAIEPVILPRETCIHGLLRSPAVESWWSLDTKNNKTLHPVEVTPQKDNLSATKCPLQEESVANVGSDLIRKVWSNDGCTDFYIGGNSLKTFVLGLEFPKIRDHGPLNIADDSRTVWIQNNSSRVSLVVDRRDDAPEVLIAAASGVVEIIIAPDALPIRLRIIVENLDLFHEGALYEPSYYGRNMAEGVWNHPEVFSLEKPIADSENQANSENQAKWQVISVVAREVKKG